MEYKLTMKALTEALIRNLLACKHTNHSLPEKNDLSVCFDCGSTKRRDEPKWVAPWAWRGLTECND